MRTRSESDLAAWLLLAFVVLALLLFFVSAATAQTTTTRTDRLAATQRIVIGTNTFGSTSPLQIVGLPARAGETNCSWVDASGNFKVGACGTVTSVGLSLPSLFSVSGSPVTTSGTLTASLATQAANAVFAGPTSGAAAAPTFRALARADLPSALAYEDEANTFSANQTIGDAAYVSRATYASQATGWRIGADGGADFRYLFADELHARSFVTDLEQALAGSQIVSKSVAVVGATFTCPAASGTATLTVRDLPSMPNAGAFQAGDWVVLRAFSRAAGTLSVSECVGQVSAYADAADGLQTWTFTRGAGGCAGGMTGGATVAVDAVVLDYGTSGQGYAEVSAVDGAWGANSPYYQVVTWATCPVAANRTVRARMGHLSGAYGYAAGSGLYGLAAGDPGGANLTVDPTNGLRLRYATANRLTLDATGLKVISPSDANTYLEAASSYVRLVAGGFERVRVNNDGSATFTGNITGAVISGSSFQTTDEKVRIDSTHGIRLKGVGSFDQAASVRWIDDVSGEAHAWWNSSTNVFKMTATAGSMVFGEFPSTTSPTLWFGGGSSTAPAPGAHLYFEPGTTGANAGVSFRTTSAAGYGAWDSFKPWTDGVERLGTADKRWSNIHLNLPFGGSTSLTYVLVNDPTDVSRLYAFTGGLDGTTTCGAGEAIYSITVEKGLVTGVACR